MKSKTAIRIIIIKKSYLKTVGWVGHGMGVGVEDIVKFATFESWLFSNGDWTMVWHVDV